MEFTILNRTFPGVHLAVVNIPIPKLDSVDGVIGWLNLRDNNFKLSGRELRFRVVPEGQSPPEIETWLQLKEVPGAPVLLFELPGHAPEQPAYLGIDTGFPHGLRLAPDIWNQWRKNHPDAPQTLTAYVMTVQGLIVAEEAWAPQVDLNGLKFLDIPVGPMNAQELQTYPPGTLAIAGLQALRRIDAYFDGKSYALLVNPFDIPPPLLGRTDFPTNGNDLAIVELPPSPPITVSAIDDFRTALNIRPDYQASRLGLKIVKTNDTVAHNQLLPRVDFVGSYGHGGLDPNFRTARDQVRDHDARAYSAGFVVRVPLAFAEGRGRARAARWTLRQTEADLVRLEQDIALGVSAAAGQIETTQQRVKVSRRALELAHQALDAEEKRLKAGTSTTFFVLQQQELLAQVENSYARALADQRRALATYERETGTTLERHQITLTDMQP